MIHTTVRGTGARHGRRICTKLTSLRSLAGENVQILHPCTIATKELEERAFPSHMETTLAAIGMKMVLIRILWMQRRATAWLLTPTQLTTMSSQLMSSELALVHDLFTHVTVGRCLILYPSFAFSWMSCVQDEQSGKLC